MGWGDCFFTIVKSRKVNYWSANDFHLINFQVQVIEKAINRSDKANENRDGKLSNHETYLYNS